jgi:hypothetical protein
MQAPRKGRRREGVTTEQVDGLLRDLTTHTSNQVGAKVLTEARRHLRYFGYVKVPFIVPDAVKQAIAEEVLRLIEQAGIRRDLRFAETDNTPRRMRNVRNDAITTHGQVIPAVYQSPDLLETLSNVAGEDVLVCPYEPERYLITCLERTGDTHGWHWDDYSVALVWVIECPPVELGGFVQCVPDTSWDKSNPQVYRAIVSGPTYSVELRPGDLYMMRTDTTLHRVHPIEDGRRIILNMGYASRTDLAKSISHETMDSLWASDLAANEARS